MADLRTRRTSKTLKLIISSIPSASKIPIVETPLINPIQGIPPPIDESLSICSATSELTCTEVELISMQAATRRIESEIQTAITEYKEINAEHLHKRNKSNRESSVITQELNIRKDSWKNMLEETLKKKSETREDKPPAETETLIDPENIFLQSRETIPMNIMGELTLLKNAINQMNDRLVCTEERISWKENENNSLKDAVVNLKDIINEKKTEKKANCAACSSCIMF